MSNTITNIGRVSGRRNPTPAGNSSVVLATVEANGFSLVLLPNEDPGALFAQAEAVIEEKDAKPGLGLEPDVMPWEVVEAETEESPLGLTDGEPEPLGELEFMAATLTTLRLGLVKPIAWVDAAVLEEIEDEQIGADFCAHPYLY